MAAGQPYDLFWRLTLREVANVFRGLVEREKGAAMQRRATIHSTAVLLAFATHDPKKLPDFEEFVHGKREERFASDDELSAYFSARAALAKKR